MLDEELRENRLQWIRALESGKYRKGLGALYGPVAESKSGSLEGYGWCCIGVWYAMHGDTGDPDGWNNNGDYDDWIRATGSDLSLNEHLVAMNDGAPLHTPGGFLMRKGLTRSHPFIARFLRKVWGLTDAG